MLSRLESTSAPDVDAFLEKRLPHVRGIYEGIKQRLFDFGAGLESSATSERLGLSSSLRGSGIRNRQAGDDVPRVRRQRHTSTSTGTSKSTNEKSPPFLTQLCGWCIGFLGQIVTTVRRSLNMAI